MFSAAWPLAVHGLPATPRIYGSKSNKGSYLFFAFIED
jgi:hypothetical protein